MPSSPLPTLAGPQPLMALPMMLPDKSFIFALSDAVQNGANLAEQSAEALYPLFKSPTGYVGPKMGYRDAFHSTFVDNNRNTID